jgi:hypothetical protein
MIHAREILVIVGIGMVLAAAGILTHDLALEIRDRIAFTTSVDPIPPIPKSRWRTAMAFAVLGWAPLVVGVGLAALAAS